MKNKLLLIVASCVFLGSAVLWWFSSREGPHVIQSEDDVVTLEVPPHALPDGIAARSISVKRVERGAGTQSYDFETDGLEFSSPVRMSMKTTLTEREGHMVVPLLVQLSEDGDIVDVLDGVHTVIDMVSRTVTTSADLRHFSEYATLQVNYLKLVVKMPEKPFVVGQPLTLAGEAWLMVPENDMVAPDNIGYLTARLEDIYYAVSGTARPIGAPGTLKPEGIVFDKPKNKTEMRGWGSFVKTDFGEFSCAKKGDAILEWEVAYRWFIVFDEKELDDPDSVSAKSRYGSIQLRIPVSCVATAADMPVTCNWNGKIDLPTEECDGPDFGGKTCQKLILQSFDYGQLLCTRECKIDSRECTNTPPPRPANCKYDPAVDLVSDDGQRCRHWYNDEGFPCYECFNVLGELYDQRCESEKCCHWYKGNGERCEFCENRGGDVTLNECFLEEGEEYQLIPGVHLEPPSKK